MKTERLYEDRKIVLEKFDNSDYRVTFFRDDHHWGGDITFNEKNGVILDDVKPEIENFKYQKEWDEHDYDAVEGGLTPKISYQFGREDALSDDVLNDIVNIVLAWVYNTVPSFEDKNVGAIQYIKTYLNSKHNEQN